MSKILKEAWDKHKKGETKNTADNKKYVQPDKNKNIFYSEKEVVEYPELLEYNFKISDFIRDISKDKAIQTEQINKLLNYIVTNTTVDSLTIHQYLTDIKEKTLIPINTLKNRLIEIREKIKKEIKIKEIKEERGETEYVKETLPYIQLPQENKVIVSGFIKGVSELIKKTDTFYRIGDDSIVEIKNNGLKTISPVRMVSLMEEVCIPVIERWNDYTKQYVYHKKSSGEQNCKILLASPILHNKLRVIEKTLNVSIPILTDNKLTFPKKGYNEELKLYLNQNAPEITNSNMPLKEAKKILLNLFGEFCFKTEDDCIKAMLALLTPFCRGLYNSWNTRTPLFIYFANRERAGKDYCAGIRSIIFEGNAIEEPPIATGKGKFGNSENDELRKKILSTILVGKTFLHFANNKGFINNSILEQLITSTVWSDRLLGGNKTATFDNILEVSLSGNIGTTLTPDLSNRSIIINLFLGIENANDREFNNPNLWQQIKDDRSNVLNALYALVRNWYEKGMKKSDIVFSSFPDWAAICCGIIEDAGFKNPCEKRDDSNITLDTELEEMKRLFEYIYELKPNDWIKKNQIKKMIRSDDEEDAMMDIFPYIDFSKRPDQIKFGMLIDKYAGREIGGITMIVDRTIKTKHKQKFMFTESPPQENLNLNEIFDGD